MKKSTTDKLTLNVRRKRVEIRTNVNTGIQATSRPKSQEPTCTDASRPTEA